MNIDAINKWLVLVANIGVIAGILFLAYEIRQSTLVAVASNDIALRADTGSLNESVYANREIADLLHEARDPDAEFSGADYQMLGSYVARQFNNWGAIERAYRAGLTSPDALDAALDDVRWAHAYYPGLEPNYSEMVASYPAHRNSVIYQTMGELIKRD